MHYQYDILCIIMHIIYRMSYRSTLKVLYQIVYVLTPGNY